MSPFPADCGALARSNPTGALGTAAHLRVPGLLTLRWNSPGVQGLSWGQGGDCRSEEIQKREKEEKCPRKAGRQRGRETCMIGQKTRSKETVIPNKKSSYSSPK